MNHQRTILAASTIAFLGAVLVNCGDDEGNDGNRSANTANDSGTDGSFVAEDGAVVGDSGAQDAQDCTSCYHNNATNAGCPEEYTSNQCPCSCFTSGSSNALSSCGPSGCRCVDNANDSSQSCVAPNDTLGDAGADASDASTDADAGPVFAADCAGQVPFGPEKIDWTYSVTDDGMSSYAKVTVKGVGFALDCSKDGTFADPSQPATGPRDVLAFLCSSANWTAGLDRTTMVVYLGADNGAGPSSALSWTPNCH